MRRRPPPLRVAVVGCGAHAELAYLPALARTPAFALTSLIDADPARARHLAERFRVPHHGASIDALPPTVEAAVVALPHDLHGPVSCELLRRRLHVLCEKPMATTLADAEAMVRAAREHGVCLYVGNIFRQYWTSLQVRAWLATGALGALERFRIEVGYVHDWPTTSGFFFDRARAGGGVLMDMGAHVLDLLLWWLGAYPTAIDYRDDAWGGVEAECRLTLGFDGGPTGTVRLSRLMTLDNVYRLQGRGGAVSFRPYDASGVCNAVTLERDGRARTVRATRPRRYADYCVEQLEAFADAVRGGAPATAQAESVLPSIRLIEACYRTARRLNAPWLTRPGLRDAGPAVAPAALARARVLVTGASGFIGARVAERLYFDYGVRARCLSRSYRRLARLARLPVEHVIGDVLDPAVVRAAVAGCDVVVHCAYGKTGDPARDRRTDVEGTALVARAALEAGVRRFVYLSSVEVYGRRQPPVVDETTPPGPPAHGYGASKLAAERACLELHRAAGLPAVVLRLAVVYGPHAPIWTIDVVNRLRSRGYVLCDRFDGLCNHLYVDDCVDAVLRALAVPDAVGEVFLVSGGEAVTWNEYFRRVNALLGLPPLERVPRWRLRLSRAVRLAFDALTARLGPRYGSEMLFAYGYLRERRRVPDLKTILQRGSLLAMEEIFARRTVYRIDKARRVLGFAPRHDLDAGLRLVAQWLAGGSTP